MEVMTAKTRLEVQQIYKLLQSVRHDDFDEINKLIDEGVPQ